MLKKKINLLLLLLISFIGLTSCVDTPPTSQKKQLDAPIIELTEDETSITWNSISHATHYEIYINEDFICEITKTFYTLEILYKDYDIKIKACDDTNGYINSAFSNVLTVEYTNTEIPPVIQPKNLQANFMMINDTHGAFIDEGTPGLERVAGLLDSLTLNGDEYIKIANGDIFQGSYVSNIYYGQAMVEVLNELDFDAFVLGNHEFDWGLDKIKNYKDGNLANGELECPILGANVVYKNTSKIVDFLEPYHIVEVDGLKVGIIGLMGYGLESSILTEYVTGYKFLHPTEIVKKYSTILRTEMQCDIVVASIHDYDENVNEEIASITGAGRVDAIFCGHTHQRILTSVTRTDGVKIPVIQNYSQNGTAAVVKIKITESGDFDNYEAKHYYPNDYNKSSSLSSIVNKYQSDINEGNRVLGAAQYYLSKQTIGQLTTNAMKNKFNADIAIMNTGGVRGTIDYGNITVSMIYNVFPFNNVIYTVNLPGSKVISLYNNNASFLYFNSDFDINDISSGKTYSIAVIDYVFTSPYYSEFKNVQYTNTSILMRDIFVEFIEDNF